MRKGIKIGYGLRKEKKKMKKKKNEKRAELTWVIINLDLQEKRRFYGPRGYKHKCCLLSARMSETVVMCSS